MITWRDTVEESKGERGLMAFGEQWSLCINQVNFADPSEGRAIYTT